MTGNQSTDEERMRRLVQRRESWRSIDDQLRFYQLRSIPLGGVDGLAGIVDDELGQPMTDRPKYKFLPGAITCAILAAVVILTVAKLWGLI